MGFSYKMDPSETRVDFTLRIKEERDVSFNLVAPMNDVKLMVGNTKGELDEAEAEVSTDGYILIMKQDLQGKDFTVSVVKAKDS